MTDIEKILKSHALWLAGEGGTRADLSGAVLSGANLRGANLSGQGRPLVRCRCLRSDLHRAGDKWRARRARRIEVLAEGGDRGDEQNNERARKNR